MRCACPQGCPSHCKTAVSQNNPPVFATERQADLSSCSGVANVKPPPRHRWRATSTETVLLSCERRHEQGHTLCRKGLHVLVVYGCRPMFPARMPRIQILRGDQVGSKRLTSDITQKKGASICENRDPWDSLMRKFNSVKTAFFRNRRYSKTQLMC